ncbi:MAG: hypothetical protein QXW62_05430 [Candidatus Methanomethylicaceae archaeon]|nr:hypothetical protein [Candidatus Verstraetearchaeota archaeon]
MDIKNIPSLIVIFLIIIGISGCIFASIFLEFIILLAFVEITSVAMFYAVLTNLISSHFPDKLKAESIFYCGLAKEPYMKDECVYIPNVPLLNMPYDTNWDEYYDKSYIKVEKNE